MAVQSKLVLQETIPDDLVKINNIWKRQNSNYPYFLRHINSNTQDNRAANLEWVHISDALDHLLHDRWAVDWAAYLTLYQIRLVVRAVINGLTVTDHKKMRTAPSTVPRQE